MTKEKSDKNKRYYTIRMIDGFEWKSNTYDFFTDIEEDYERLREKIERFSKSIGIEIKNFH